MKDAGQNETEDSSQIAQTASFRGEARVATKS